MLGVGQNGVGGPTECPTTIEHTTVQPMLELSY